MSHSLKGGEDVTTARHSLCADRKLQGSNSFASRDDHSARTDCDATGANDSFAPLPGWVKTGSQLMVSDSTPGSPVTRYSESKSSVTSYRSAGVVMASDGVERAQCRSNRVCSARGLDVR